MTSLRLEGFGDVDRKLRQFAKEAPNEVRQTLVRTGARSSTRVRRILAGQYAVSVGKLRRQVSFFPDPQRRLIVKVWVGASKPVPYKSSIPNSKLPREFEGKRVFRIKRAPFIRTDAGQLRRVGVLLKSSDIQTALEAVVPEEMSEFFPRELGRRLELKARRIALRNQK